MMTEEMSKNFDLNWSKNADKQLDLSRVLNTTAAALCADKLYGTMYAEAMGKTADAPERKVFIEKMMLWMPHYISNGSDKVIACDWVKAKEDEKANRPIRQYRLAGTDIVTLTDKALWTIPSVEEVPVMETHTYASGFVKEIPALDEEGKTIKEEVEVQLVPRKKSAWGYTQVVKDAIKATLNEMF